MIFTPASFSRVLLGTARSLPSGVKSATLFFTAVNATKPLAGRHDVAGPQRRIGFDVDVRQTEAIAAVAGGIGDQLFAIEEGGVEIGVAAAVRGDGVVDAAAGIKPRAARRAERMAGVRPRSGRLATAPGSKSRRWCARSRRWPGRFRRAARGRSGAREEVGEGSA